MSEVKRQARLIIGTLILALVGEGLSAVFSWGWIGANVLTVVLMIPILVHVFRYRDLFIGKLFVFGTVAGFGELAADYWAAHVYGTLTYSPGGPWLPGLPTPLYMPFGWAVALTQLGWIAWWLTDRYGLTVASILSAIIGGINIPIYETLAHYADYWNYHDCWMVLGTTPYFIILFEILVGLSLPLLVRFLRRGQWGSAVGSGVAMSVWMWIVLVVSYWLVGQPPA